MLRLPVPSCAEWHGLAGKRRAASSRAQAPAAKQPASHSCSPAPCLASFFAQDLLLEHLVGDAQEPFPIPRA